MRPSLNVRFPPICEISSSGLLSTRRGLYAWTQLGGPEASTAQFIVGWHIRAAHEISSGIALALVIEMPQLLPQLLAALVLDA